MEIHWKNQACNLQHGNSFFLKIRIVIYNMEIPGKKSGL
jgi:hypothetical protein